ncbi:MAG: mammalian cell entry protein, partial [Smithella sp.]
MQELETKLSRIITRIDKIPLEDIGRDAGKALANLNQTVKDADRMLKHIDAETVPEIKATMQELRKTIKTAESVLGNADKTFTGKGAPAQQELRTALQEVARAARSISELAEYLERNPNALIRGKTQEVPK